MITKRIQPPFRFPAGPLLRGAACILLWISSLLGTPGAAVPLAAAEPPRAPVSSSASSASSPAGSNGPSRHWAFQPIQRPSLPRPHPGAGPLRTPVDYFVLARLQAVGLEWAPEADRVTLIRRLSFDLLGLPPTPAEVDRFLNDPAPDAYEKLVDRLLASPRHGERWGRHWLDLARYTESQGFEYDKLRDNAWHYRDYVIRSFNEDKPYDRFMQEQVAGDVLEPITADGILATSLLVCGAWDEAGNAQANVTQKAITREEEMEDLISVVGQTFLGLSVNCARCHAHKFDPIPQEEYYRIKSVFDGVKHGERAFLSASSVRAREQHTTGLRAELGFVERDVAVLEGLGWKAASRGRARDSNAPGSVSAASAAGPAPLARWTFEEEGGRGGPVMSGELKDGATLANGRLRLDPAGGYFQSAPLPRDIGEKTLEAWVSLADLQQGGGAAISIETDDAVSFDAIVFGEREPGRWMAGSDSFARTRDLDGPVENTPPDGMVHMMAVYQTNGTIALFRNGVPYGKPYQPSRAPQTFPAGRSRVLLGLRHHGGGRPFLRGEIAQAALYDRALTAEEVSAAFRLGRWHVPVEQVLASLTPDQRSARGSLLARAARLQLEIDAVKPAPVSYVGTRVQPAPTRRLKRGDVNSPEEYVTPGALSALSASSSLRFDFGLATNAPEAERRVEFARWLVDARNPLPARVIANRLWQYHFGQALVATPSDFGAAGARPSHPELLDWLASTLMDQGWRLKSLHRLIVTSTAYRQSSRFEAKAAQLDADNQLLWRYPPRRLEAEVLRDAMLLASGELTLPAGGPSFRPFELLKFPANAYVPTDKEGADFNRRSVYRMNVNSGKEPMLDAFDCPDPSVKTPRRGITTTPLQALGLMNNSFVQRQAARLAGRSLAEAGQDLPGAVRLAYRHAVGRLPSPEETARAVEAARSRTLTNVCWTLLNSTEFVYVR